MKEIFFNLEQSLLNHKNAVLCSITASTGSTPRGSGAKMLVFEDGSISGTIGGGAVEFRAINTALDIHKNKCATIEKFCLAKNDVADLGMICGGNVTVYFRYFSCEDEADVNFAKRTNSLMTSDKNVWLITELTQGKSGRIGTYDEENGLTIPDMSIDEITPHLESKGVLAEDKLFIEPLVRIGYVYIFGGGHVSQELVPVIAKVGFRPIIFEDRERFADINLFKGAEKTILGDFNHPEQYLNIRPEDYIVIMTRGHQADYTVLEFALRSPASYVGVIGSKSKMASTREKLLSAGIPESDLPRIHNPIGLPIKAETPAEIAISVAAELILHRAEH